MKPLLFLYGLLVGLAIGSLLQNIRRTDVRYHDVAR